MKSEHKKHKQCIESMAMFINEIVGTCPYDAQPEGFEDSMINCKEICGNEGRDINSYRCWIDYFIKKECK